MYWGKDFGISSRLSMLNKCKRVGCHTGTQAGPETRTTAIAARPGAVDSAYIVESPSNINRAGRVDVKPRIRPGVLRADSGKRP